jgi:flagellar assembly protein FliH
MATIIRQHESVEARSGRTVQGVAFNFEDMNDRANEYLETVRREAAKIVQQAHQQAEQVRRQAEVAGRSAAEQTAQRIFDEQMAEQLKSLIAALDRVVAETNDAKAAWLHRWEQSALAVAAAMAERIIRRELQREPEISLEWIREALQMAAGADDVTLCLHPADHTLLGSRARLLVQSLSGLAPTQVVADPAVSPGGCVVKTRHGRIDQQIESQLARIQEELT